MYIIHPCYLSNENKYLLLKANLLMFFKVKSMFEPKVFKCVIKMNITNVNSF